MSELQWNFMEGSGVVKGTCDLNFGRDLDHDLALAEVYAPRVIGI